MSFALAVRNVLRNEGGYVNDPSDRGGETNWGITIATARTHGYSGPMKSMQRADAERIYKLAYWDVLQLDEIDALFAALADRLFDVSVNQGPGAAGTFLQRALNVMNRGQQLYPDLAVDGAVGPATLAALRALAVDDLAIVTKLVEVLQGYRYLTIMEHDPGQERFARGWLNRLKS